MNHQKILGKRGELAAKNWLIKNNYQIIATNLRIKNYEIDIIARKNGFIVFFEIKTGYYLENDQPLKNNQLQSLKKARLIYCQKNHFSPEKTRLDLIILNPKGKTARLKWLANISP